LDVRRDLARELAHLAQRLDDGTIESIHRGEVCDGRMLEETRLGEAGASPEEIARTRDMGLDRRGERVTPTGPERPDGTAAGAGPYHPLLETQLFSRLRLRETAVEVRVTEPLFRNVLRNPI